MAKESLSVLYFKIFAKKKELKLEISYHTYIKKIV